MGRFLFQVFSYISHYLKRKDEHSLHSPFLFDFYCKTVKARQLFNVDSIELYRKSLFENKSVYFFVEHGALKESRKEILFKRAKSSLSPHEQSCFLGALVKYFSPLNILELGTSFGVSTSYLAYFAPLSKVITLEGEPQISKLAKSYFHKSLFRNIELIEGQFDKTLLGAVDKFNTLDLVFFDGNHKYGSTLMYFEICLKKVNENSVFIFHDICWSKEMKNAWEEIKESQSVTLSIDLFYFGVVFFRKNQPKQHFVLKF